MWHGRRRENFKRQDRIMLNLVGGEQPPEDFGRRISDLFFRKSSLAAVKKNDYIFKSFLNYSYYDTFFIGLKTSLRWRWWTRCLIIPLTFWDLDFALSLFFRLPNLESRFPAFMRVLTTDLHPLVCTYSILYFPFIFTPWHCHLNLTMDYILKSVC